jgi:hypothetical protein
MLPPNVINAVVDERKLRDYCLCPDHPRGKHKARVFASALDLVQNDFQELRNRILAAANTEECMAVGTDSFGRRYQIDFEWTRGEKTATVRTMWI